MKITLLDRVTYNTFVQFIGKAVVGLSAFLLLSILTRSLGEDGYGAYALIFTWVIILSVFADMGLYLTGVRELSKPRANQNDIFGNLLSLKLISTFIVITGASIILFFLPYAPLVKNGIVITFLLIFALFGINTIKSIFQSRLEMQFAVIGETAGTLVSLALSFLVLKLGFGLLAVVWAAIIGIMLNLLIAVSFSSRFVSIHFRFDPNIIKALVRESFPLGLSAIMAVVYFRVDLLMLSWMKPLDDVGIYGAAYRIVEIAAIIPALFLGTVFPLLTKAIETQDGTLSRLYDRSFGFVTSLAIPMLVGGLILADPLMLLLTGEDFATIQTFDIPFFGLIAFDGTGATFRILLVATALMFWGQLNGHLMIAGNMQKKLLHLYFVILPANVLLNIILIPRYSYIGAAATTLTTEVIAIMYTSWVVGRNLNQLPRCKRLMQAVAASIPMGLLVWWLEIHILPLIIIGAFCYFVILHLFGGTVGLNTIKPEGDTDVLSQ